MSASLRRRLVPTTGPQCDDLSRRILRRSLDFSCSALVSCQHQINKYSAPCGDGLADVARSILSDLETGLDLIDCRYPAGVLYNLGLAVAEVAWDGDGKVGAGLSLFLLRWAENLEQCEVADLGSWVEGAKFGLDNLEATGWKADIVEHGLGPVIRGFAADVGEGKDWVVALERAAMSAEEGAVGTALHRGGVADSHGGVVADSHRGGVADSHRGGVADSACHALGVAVRAVYQAVKLETQTIIPSCDSSSSQTDAGHISIDSTDSEKDVDKLDDDVSDSMKIHSEKKENDEKGKCDMKVIEAVMIHSEISNSESNNEQKRHAEVSDSVLVYTEIRDPQSKHDVEVSDYVLMHSEPSHLETKNKEKRNVEKEDSVLMHSEESFQEGKRDTKTIDSMEIHSEISHLEAKSDAKHYSDVSDSVFTHSEISHTDAKTEGSDSVLIHSEISNPELKDYGKRGSDSALGDSVLMHSDISDPVPKCDSVAWHAGKSDSRYAKRLRNEDENDSVFGEPDLKRPALIYDVSKTPALPHEEKQDAEISDSVLMHSEISHPESKDELKSNTEDKSISDPQNRRLPTHFVPTARKPISYYS